MYGTNAMEEGFGAPLSSTSRTLALELKNLVLGLVYTSFELHIGQCPFFILVSPWRQKLVG
jgi:hypothetical protein